MLLMDYILNILAIIGGLSILFIIFLVIDRERDKKEAQKDYQGQIKSLENCSRFLMTQLSIVNRIALRLLSPNSDFNNFTDDEKKEVVRFLESLKTFEEYVVINEEINAKYDEKKRGFLNFKEYILTEHQGFYPYLFDLRFIANRVKTCLILSDKNVFVDDKNYILEDDLKKINNVLELLNSELEANNNVYRRYMQ